MKKGILFSVVLLTLLFTGCSRKNEKTWDANQTSMLPGMFQEVDSGYLMCRDSGNGEYLYYADKETMEWVPLCGKPDCSHDRGTGNKNCNAYLQGSSYFGVYGDSIYFVTGGKENAYEIWKMGMDGTNHERVGELPMIEESQGGYMSLLCHRDSLFYIAIQSNKTGAAVMSQVRRYSLGDREVEIIDEIEGEVNVLPAYYPYEDKLYVERPENGQYNLYEYDLDNGKYRCIYENWKPAMSFQASGEGIFHVAYLDGIYYLDFKTGEDRCIHEFSEDETGTAYTDGEYFYYGNLSPFIYTFGTPIGEETVFVYDKEWNPVQELELPAGKRLYFQIATGDRVLFSERAIENLPEYILDRTKIGTDECKWE